MFQIEELRVFVAERLHAAAADILGVVERTLTDYEEQASRLRRETERQRTLLDVVLRPKLPEKAGPSTTTYITPAPSETEHIHTSFQVRNPSPLSDPQCAFNSREEFLRFAGVGNCPYCFKETEASEMHLAKRHYFFAIHFTENGIGKFIVPCACKERINGRSHWHCPTCGKTIYRKNNFEVHLSNQHGLLLQQQSRDMEHFQQSMSFGEGELPPEQWCWPELSSLCQGEQGEQEPSPLPLIKEEKEEPSIGPEGRQCQVHPSLPSSRNLEELENLQIKEEQHGLCRDWTGDHARGLEMGVSHVATLNQSPALSTRLGQIHGVDYFPASPVELSEVASGVLKTAGDHLQPTVDGSSDKRGNPSPKSSWKLGCGSRSALKIRKSQRVETVKRHRRYVGSKWKKSVHVLAVPRASGPFHCKLCGKSFYCMSTLVKHSQTHTRDKAWICGVCGEDLESTEHLTQHLETHKERYKCFVCGKCFSRNSSLKQHRRIHGAMRADSNTS